MKYHCKNCGSIFEPGHKTEDVETYVQNWPCPMCGICDWRLLEQEENKMAQITLLEGDLLDQKTDVIAHQVNCLGVMGAGVALQIKNRWPEVYEGYRNFCHDELKRLGTLRTEFLLGKCMVCISDDGNPAIANLFGQDRFDKMGRNTSYDAVYDALVHLREIMENHGWKSVSFPYGMSCGLGGGSWNVIYAMICDVFENSNIEVRIVKKIWGG
jgi:O-acetyl-ADP-ribose deacetylase (regulator of RNase III)/rubredoxin